MIVPLGKLSHVDHDPCVFFSFLFFLATNAQRGRGSGHQSLLGDLSATFFTDTKASVFKPPKGIVDFFDQSVLSFSYA
jgi:hypothetical protein